MNVKLKLVLVSFLFIIIVLFLCEFLMYYLVIISCDWPKNESKVESEEGLKAMILSDIHLLGRLKGHWFDKIRREWQMFRSFQTSIHLFNPNVVIILGDIFDEGLWASDQHFNQYVHRFHQLFYVDSSYTKLYVVVGNHDIGFHYWTDKYLRRRFETAFNTSDVDLINAGNDIHFVRINSIAMEGDNCYLCVDAVNKLRKIGQIIKNKNISPIVLMHFPLYRESEEICTESDSASIEEKSVKYREKYDCLSKESTNLIIDVLNPRLILTGHSHHSCIVTHKNNVKEWTVASFSWRNKKNPSFLLARITSNNYLISKCFLPNENTVFNIYFTSLFLLICLIILTIFVQLLAKYKKD